MQNLRHSDDFEHILAHTRPLWDNIRGKTLFISGGTGFFGKWLLEAFLYANQQLALNAKAIVLSRNPALFTTVYPHCSQDCVTYLTGDIQGFAFPEEPVHYIIHAATTASAALNTGAPLEMFETIVAGTRRMLELGRVKNVAAILHTSSGAVYGSQPSDITHIAEDFAGAPDVFHPGVAYAEGKRVAEMYAGMYHRQFGVPSKIARCFAFVGPYLPLDTHFAIGNFIYDVLKHRDIEIKGDGSPYRSYLYASDLVIWLYKILFDGAVMEPYNVGSDDGYDLAGIAGQVARFGRDTKVNAALPRTDAPPARYVPSVKKAGELLGLRVTVPLPLAIQKTINFYKDIQA